MKSIRLILLSAITFTSAISLRADHITPHTDNESQASITCATDNDSIVFLDYNSFETVADIIRPYRGRPVLIDLWGTFCKPCIKSFAHVKPLQECAAENGIQLLYIDLDDSERMTQRWKDLVLANNLLGHHVITNLSVAKDVHSVFRRNGKVQLPSYATVDREGNLRLLDISIADMSDFSLLKSELEKIK
ncbi:MAG: redoxin family protein [Duncaniella sp.]|nr:redoxin family protein [Duncaniella sp.]